MKNKLCCPEVEKNYLIGCKPKRYVKKKYKKYYKTKYKPKKFDRRNYRDYKKPLWRKRTNK